MPTVGVDWRRVFRLALADGIADNGIMADDFLLLPRRRHHRLSDYDYSGSGAYFVTICTRMRSCLFGNVIGDEMVLNDAGRVVHNELARTSAIRPHSGLDTWATRAELSWASRTQVLSALLFVSLSRHALTASTSFATRLMFLSGKQATTNTSFARTLR